MNEKELTNFFSKLGAQNPEGWARSQITEGIPQLARFLFLRQAWKRVVGANDTSWIERELQANATEPGGAIVSALRRLLAKDVAETDLTTVVRVMQWQLLFALCQLLDDPGDLEKEVEDVTWSLFQTDDMGRPIRSINALHESVLETEPSGREMRD
jgi:hypothetical protein